MKKSQKLLLSISEKRQRLSELASKETLADAEAVEQREALAAIPKLEVEYRAAIEGEQSRVPTPDASQSAEFRGLVDTVRLGRYLQAAVEGNAIRDGAEFELRSELQLPADEIPWVAIAPREETRADAVTPAPGTTAVVVEQALGRIFKDSVAAFLGVRFPNVSAGTHAYPVLSTGPTAAAKAKGGDTDSVAGAYTIKSVTPTRIAARFSFAAEDVALYPALEMDLRRDLSQAISDQLDQQVIVGGAAAPNFTGSLLRATADPADPTAAITAATALGAIAGHLDGLLAKSFSDIRAVFGPKTVVKLATLFRNANVSETALDLINRLIGAGNIRTSGFLPAPDANIQKYIIRLGDEQSAVAPSWGGVRVIRDNLSGSGKAETYVTAFGLFGFGVVRLASFAQGEFKLA